MKRATKTALIWGILLVIVIAVLVNRDGNNKAPIPISAAHALELIEADLIYGYHYRDRLVILSSAEEETFSLPFPIPEDVARQLAEHEITYFEEQDRFESTERIWMLSFWLIPAAILVVALVYFLRKMSGRQLNSVFEFKKSKVRAVAETDKAKFTDIGGNRDAIEVLADIVDFLREPSRWIEAGARIPRGVLLTGPPGTGKTLLARAVAGETDSSFFYTSATEFIEFFVGVGAARVRDAFEKAAALQSAVLFIDELDAIGRRRGSGNGMVHEEREQTLNQLLVSLDGLEKRSRLVVIAATNRQDVLDPALLRSGRFDRIIRLNSPVLDERVEILKVHTRNKPLDGDGVLEHVAGQTEGFTGADLEALTNEALLRALRRSRVKTNGDQKATQITKEDFDCALQSMKSSNRQFDQLDSILVDSVSQFAEPTGTAAVAITLSTGKTVEGEILWMNSSHIKVRTAEGTEVILSKDRATHIVALAETQRSADFKPDPWAGRDVGSA